MITTFSGDECSRLLSRVHTRYANFFGTDAKRPQWAIVATYLPDRTAPAQAFNQLATVTIKIYCPTLSIL